MSIGVARGEEPIAIQDEEYRESAPLKQIGVKIRELLLMMIEDAAMRRKRRKLPLRTQRAIVEQALVNWLFEQEPELYAKFEELMTQNVAA